MEDDILIMEDQNNKLTKVSVVGPFSYFVQDKRKSLQLEEQKQCFRKTTEFHGCKYLPDDQFSL